jgi:hypothetical protein
LSVCGFEYARGGKVDGRKCRKHDKADFVHSIAPGSVYAFAQSNVLKRRIYDRSAILFRAIVCLGILALGDKKRRSLCSLPRMETRMSNKKILITGATGSGICKEPDTETHCGYVVWLAGDNHIAAFQFVDNGAHAIDAETRVMPPRHVVAVMQILIAGAFCCARAGHQLEMKTIVSGRIKKAKAKPGYEHSLLNRKSSLSAYQATAMSKSGTRMAV